MLIVETIRKIRLMILRDGKSIRQTAKELRLSRNTVRKALRSQQTAFEYRRRRQPRPAIGRYMKGLEEDLARDQKLPKRQRRTAIALYEGLQGEGYTGSYDSVRRHVREWREQKSSNVSEVYIPLVFDPGEAFQFDWSHEQVEMDGMPMTVKVAHLRLCHSRYFLVTAYPRETQEMVFDAHIRAFEFFGGVCQRGIYDNLKAVVNKVLSGKERNFNSRFGQLCSHYLFEPVACTPAAGWEKGPGGEPGGHGASPVLHAPPEGEGLCRAQRLAQEPLHPVGKVPPPSRSQWAERVAGVRSGEGATDPFAAPV